MPEALMLFAILLLLLSTPFLHETKSYLLQCLRQRRPCQ